MSNRLQFQKVISLPTELESNTIYLLVENDRLSIHLSDSEGSKTYHTIKPVDVVPETATIVHTVDALPNPSVVLKPALFALTGISARPIWYDGTQYIDLYKSRTTTEVVNGDVIFRDYLEFGISLM